MNLNCKIQLFITAASSGNGTKVLDSFVTMHYNGGQKGNCRVKATKNILEVPGCKFSLFDMILDYFCLYECFGYFRGRK